MLFTFPESLERDTKECVESLFIDGKDYRSISVSIRKRYKEESEKYPENEVWEHGVHKYWYALSLAVISKVEDEYDFKCFSKAVVFLILNLWRGILYG